MDSTVTLTEPAQIITLPLGRARRPWVPIRRQVVQFRRLLERAVVEIHGGVDLRRAKLVRTACTAFESAQRIRRQLAYGGEPGSDNGLDHQTWLAYDSALQGREASCDRALSALGLDRSTADVWDSILPPAPAATSPPAVENGDGKAVGRSDTTDAAGATPGGEPP